MLLSILSYVQRDEVGNPAWLEGECGDERSLVGATPTSDAFVRYALGWRAATLRPTSARFGRRAPRSTCTTSGWCANNTVILAHKSG